MLISKCRKKFFCQQLNVKLNMTSSPQLPVNEVLLCQRLIQQKLYFFSVSCSQILNLTSHQQAYNQQLPQALLLTKLKTVLYHNELIMNHRFRLFNAPFLSRVLSAKNPSASLPLQNTISRSGSTSPKKHFLWALPRIVIATHWNTQEIAI